MKKQFNPKECHIPKTTALRPIIKQASMRTLCLEKKSDKAPPAKMAAVKPSHAEDPRRPASAIVIPRLFRMAGRAVPRIV
jgi:hypothetical protein